MEAEADYILDFSEDAPLDDYRHANTHVLRVGGLLEDGQPLRVQQNFHLGKGGILWDAVG